MRSSDEILRIAHSLSLKGVDFDDLILEVLLDICALLPKSPEEDTNTP